MKLRHAAALALVGWYRMLPPVHAIGRSNEEEVEVRAPISEWNLYTGEPGIGVWTQHPSEATVFHSRQECEAEVEKVGTWAEKFERMLHPTAQINWLQFGPWFNAKCIASDDPRLKTN